MFKHGDRVLYPSTGLLQPEREEYTVEAVYTDSSGRRWVQLRDLSGQLRRGYAEAKNLWPAWQIGQRVILHYGREAQRTDDNARIDNVTEDFVAVRFGLDSRLIYTRDGKPINGGRSWFEAYPEEQEPA